MKIVHTEALDAIILITKEYELDDSEWSGFWLTATQEPSNLEAKLLENQWGKLVFEETNIGEVFDTVDISVEVYDDDGRTSYRWG